jgi:hypothetical protein
MPLKVQAVDIPGVDPSERDASQCFDRAHAHPDSCYDPDGFLLHRSRASLRLPQCFSLREESNTRSTCRFRALITPIRANMVGPPLSATSMSASIAASHSGSAASFFGSPGMYVAASWRVRSVRPPGSETGSSNSRDQPRLLMAPALLVEFGLEAFRHPRRAIIIARVAPPAGSPSAAAGAGALTFRWTVRMVLAHPATVLAEQAFHRNAHLLTVPSGKIRNTGFPSFRAKRTVDHVPERNCSSGSAGAAISDAVSRTISLLRSRYGLSGRFMWRGTFRQARSEWFVGGCRMIPYPHSSAIS